MNDYDYQYSYEEQLDAWQAERLNGYAHHQYLGWCEHNLDDEDAREPDVGEPATW